MTHKEICAPDCFVTVHGTWTIYLTAVGLKNFVAVAAVLKCHPLHTSEMYPKKISHDYVPLK